MLPTAAPLMRVALVDPYFLPELGYQTTGWYRALAARGHKVRAFTSCFISTVVRHLYPRPFPPGLSVCAGGEVLRLPARQLPRDIVRCPQLLSAVAEYQPEITLAIYPGTMFARDLFRQRRRISGVLFSTYAENRAQRSGTPWLARALLDAAFYTLKRRAYRRFIETSDAALLQTPDTFDYILPRLASGRRLQHLRERCALSALGFDAELFRTDPVTREQERTRLGLRPEHVVALYSCKITTVKRLDVWVDALAKALRVVPALRALLVGFRDGEAESARVRALIEASDQRDRFLCLPFADRERLPRLYHAADFGVWHLQPSVTIQEAMGTGVYMLLPNSATVSHLVVAGRTGQYFPEGDFQRLPDLIVETARNFQPGQPDATGEARRQRAELNAQRFGYLRLVDQLVAAARDPAHAVTHLTLR